MAGELAEADTFMADIDSLVARASSLNAAVLRRLEDEAREDPRRAEALEKFRKTRGLRIELPAF
ncbi:hypothetical protein [Paracoccus tibetensis]|uniref:Uncharacterized protein n=1 Tax=Paracoccus tibetensis TaxID=336292 RepID=A0A1G5CYI7_9RHOB|nr:hypothetical protein [Paracoccus tibetensis]SCY07308.1 hypothetical protein SAMN05660710_00578 [Paracoccus tibetensis]